MIPNSELRGILSEIGRNAWAASHKTVTFCHGLRQSCAHIKTISSKALDRDQRRAIFAAWEEGLDVALGSDPARVARFKRLHMYREALAALDLPEAIGTDMFGDGHDGACINLDAVAKRRRELAMVS